MSGADVLLADGTTVHLRQITPQDADAVVAMHSRFSERTRYLRYFSPYPRIPARDLHRFVNVDHLDREAFVVAAGDRLVAVGRYERLGASSHEAEVAFVVEDAYQGRGVGSVLLEHLAAAAAEAGITRFVAEVLPENGAMLRVFTDAGYEVTRRYADGVVTLTFPVAPTERSRAVQADREQRTEARSVARLLRPRGVAVYGASASGHGVGAAVLAHLRAAGFAGPIHHVHPDGPLRSLADLPPSATASTADGGDGATAAAGTARPWVPGSGLAHRGEEEAGSAIDLAVVATPPGALPDVLADAAAAGVHGLLVLTELDPAQRRELVRAARVAGMRVIGPGSLGLADHAVRLNATLVPRLPGPGRVSLFCHSGTLGLLLLAEAERRGLGMSGFVSAGRRADVSGNDLLQFWAEDPQTDVVAMYLESFGNPRKFARIARTAGRHKPIVMLAGHTGHGGSALDDAAMQALRAHSGVIEVGTVGELFDVTTLLAAQPLPTGDRIGVVSNAFALSALAAAEIRAAGLRVGRSGAVGPAAGPDEFAAAVYAALHSDDTDAVVVVVAPPLPTGPLAADQSAETALLAPYADALAKAVHEADKPVLASFLAGRGPAEVPSYRSIEEAVRALAQVTRRAAWLREPPGTLPPPPPGADPLAPTIDTLLHAYGVTVVPSTRAAGGDEVAAATAAYAAPVALKVADRPNRIDLGAVRLNLGGPEEARRAYADLEALFGAGVEVLVQPMVSPGVACVVEIFDDPAFGPVVGFGLAGPVPELVGDRAWRAAPLTDTDAAALVRAPKAAPLLAAADASALAQLLVDLGRLAADTARLRHLVLNPVLVHAAGVSVLHARGELTEATPRPDTGPRQLR
ncbi:GNAT family N-acetyltransferase [Catellatospora citrea]|uniref:GNAT family N-acetyltransferase n=1 Tax=Catellatospora citrea TaxID=53366 RepID=A0A8J3K7B8_9ACTN|nr:GNAT family N-acetyltransferase [Catellatospora citrea]RKE10074.1 acyl-CoA synthetase (NDP forming) [Catellatospora citrea]GIF98016.1 GNAT family N-acetyltransferase [Catellatospora citrea]